MSTLHLVFSRTGHKACRKRCQQYDTIVLLQDGVYAEIDGRSVFMLESDSIARGVHNRLENSTLISMDQLVELTSRHKPVVSWR